VFHPALNVNQFHRACHSRKRPRRRAWAAYLAVAVAPWAGGAVAAAAGGMAGALEAGDEDAPAATGPPLEEVAVTAGRREQRLQDVPAAVAALSGELLRDSGIRQPVEVAALLPSLSVAHPAGDTGAPALFLRGVGPRDFGPLGTAPVATYVDDVYVASAAARLFPVLDVERVEVVRGPQGVLYGRNAAGGVINFVSRKPGAVWEGHASAGIGSFGARRLEGAAGGPVGHGVGIRAAVLKTESDGWMSNRFTGSDENGRDELVWRVLVQAAPEDGFEALLSLHGGRIRSDSSQHRHVGLLIPGSGVGGAATSCAVAGIRRGECVDAAGYTEQTPGTTLSGARYPAAPRYDEGNFLPELRRDTRFWGTSLSLEWTPGDFTVTSVTGYDDLEHAQPENADASPNRLLTRAPALARQRWSQELRVGRSTGRGSWLAGVWYLHDEAVDRTSLDVRRDFRGRFVGDDTGCSAPAGNPTGFCPEALVFARQSVTDQTIASLSVFGDATVDFFGAWSVSAGLRYTREEVEQDVVLAFAEPAAGNPPILQSAADNDVRNLSGRLIFHYRVDDDLTLYGGVATGFEAGGIRSAPGRQVPYGDAELVSYEAGFRSSLGGGRVHLSGALFRHEQSDVQRFGPLGDSGLPLQIPPAAADTRAVGAELELQAMVGSRTLVRLGFGWLDAEYRRVAGADLSRAELPMSPEYGVSGLIRHEVALERNDTLILQADAAYQGSLVFDAGTDPLMRQTAYWLLNGRVSWRSPRETWEVAAWGRNLRDRNHLTHALDLAPLGLHAQRLGVPRSFGLEASYRF
jgi:iron complex outermembrane recepter protein